LSEKQIRCPVERSWKTTKRSNPCASYSSAQEDQTDL